MKEVATSTSPEILLPTGYTLTQAEIDLIDTADLDWQSRDVDLDVRMLLGEKNPLPFRSAQTIVERYKGPIIGRQNIYSDATNENIQKLKNKFLVPQEARLRGKNRFATPEQTYFVWYRDRGSCQYCSKSTDPRYNLQIDHIEPWSAGGRTLVDNLACSCKDCNYAKDTMDPIEFMDRIWGPNGREELFELTKAAKDYRAWQRRRR